METIVNKLFIALPTMGSYNAGLFDKLAWFSMQKDYRITVARTHGEMFHDSARNKLCTQFLETDCQWMLFIDADVDPSPSILSLTRHDKDICGAHVFAWIQRKNKQGIVEPDLYSSIWDRAPCEECAAVEQFKKDGTNKDPREYRIDPAEPQMLLRWNPYLQVWKSFYDRNTVEYVNGNCRCNNTGRDPYVYNCSKKILEKDAPIQVDAVGAAAMLVKRRVIEGMRPPWFQFLYREMRDVMSTEDLMFCHKAKAHGFEVWADQSMPCRHFKETDLLQINQWGGRLVEATTKALMETQKTRIIVPELSGAFR